MPRLNLVAPFPQTSRTRGDAGVHVSKWPIRAAYLRALADSGLSDLRSRLIYRWIETRLRRCETSFAFPKESSVNAP